MKDSGSCLRTGRMEIGYRTYLIDLQQDLARTVAACAAAIAHIWFCWNLYSLDLGPPAFHSAPSLVWFGNAVLAVGAVASWGLAKRRSLLALRMLVIGIIGTIACVFLGSSAPSFVYLFVIPIVLSGAALDHASLIMCAVAGALTALLVDPVGPQLSMPSMHQAVAALVLAAATLVTWISSQALATALTWVWQAYGQALTNETLARRRQGELNQTLRALDEAQFRLERNNYLLALARDEAERAREVKQEFVQTVSHELRTPLNLIIGFSDIMANSPETYTGATWSANLRSDVEQIHLSGRHLSSLIDDILDLAAMEARRMRLSMEQVDVKELIDDALAVVHNLFERKGLYLEVEVEPDLPLVRVDPLRIRQVLMNLLSNASRHTERGGVTVAAQLDGDYIRVSVGDTGAGVPPDKQDAIFEEFRQIDGSPSRPHEGTGLGLALSKRFVELHGGSMGLDSVLGQGSTFYFTLPASPRSAGVRKSSLLRTPDRATALGAHRLPLLVAGAGPLLLSALCRLDDFQVVDVRNSHDIPRLVDEHRPVALVVNYDRDDLPIVAGEWLSSAPPHLPIIALPLQDRFASLGIANVQAFVLKPVRRERLLQAIDALPGDIRDILVVDDDMQFVELVSRMLESAGRGWRTMKSFSGQELLDRLRRGRPDLILLDLTLPDIDGVDALRQMASDSRKRDIPVIIVSAWDPLEMIEGGNVVSIERGSTFSSRELLGHISLLVGNLAGRSAIEKAVERSEEI